MGPDDPNWATVRVVEQLMEEQARQEEKDTENYFTREKVSRDMKRKKVFSCEKR